MASVRRTLSILLLALCTLPLLAPLLALAGTPGPGEQSLPACCRRLGAHGCAMSQAPQSASEARLATRERTVARPPQPCPFRTAVFAVTSQAPLTPVPAPAGDLYLLTQNHPRGPAQAAARHRIARERARHKRGPPSARVA